MRARPAQRTAPAGPGWIATEEGRHLRGRPSTGTKPERVLRSALHARGLRFRLHRRLMDAVRPDVVFVGARVAVFVDGCYWHSCPRHGPRAFNGPNAELWKQKMVRNHQRDAENTALLRGGGWLVHRFWECDVRSDVDTLADLVECEVRSRTVQ